MSGSLNITSSAFWGSAQCTSDLSGSFSGSGADDIVVVKTTSAMPKIQSVAGLTVHIRNRVCDVNAYVLTPTDAAFDQNFDGAFQ